MLRINSAYANRFCGGSLMLVDYSSFVYRSSHQDKALFSHIKGLLPTSYLHSANDTHAHFLMRILVQILSRRWDFPLYNKNLLISSSEFWKSGVGQNSPNILLLVHKGHSQFFKFGMLKKISHSNKHELRERTVFGSVTPLVILLEIRHRKRNIPKHKYYYIYTKN